MREEFIFMTILSVFKYKVEKKRLKRFWRKMNQHNYTSLGTISNPLFIEFIKNRGAIVGKNTYGQINMHYSGNTKELLKIGSNCSISSQADFLLGGEHDYKSITTYPYKVKKFNYKSEAKTKGAIIVDDEVWIGDKALILSGVHIGKGAIVAAGSVVVKDVPPYSIIGGNPAKVIKYRFTDTIIKKMMMIDLSDININIEDEKYLYEDITEENIDQISAYFKNKGL